MAEVEGLVQERLPLPIKTRNLHYRETAVTHILKELADGDISVQTCFLAVHLLDRVLGERSVKPGNIGLVVAVLIMMAAAYEQDTRGRKIVAFWSDKLELFRRKEVEVLQVLKHEIGWPSPLFFLHELLNKLTSMPIVLDGSLPSSAEVTDFILKASLLNISLVQQPPSAVAAAAYCLAVSMAEEAPWTTQLDQASRYSFEEFYPVMRSMCRFHTEAKARFVAIDNSSRGIADFVTAKIAAGFVVTRRYTFGNTS